LLSSHYEIVTEVVELEKPLHRVGAVLEAESEPRVIDVAGDGAQL
jgi:hypothetical protein